MSKSYENIVLDDSEDEQDRDKKTKKNKIQQYVDHAYVDYAIVEEDDLRLLDENSSLLPNPTSEGESNVREKLKGMSCTYGPMKKNAGGVVQPFPGKVSGSEAYLSSKHPTKHILLYPPASRSA